MRYPQKGHSRGKGKGYAFLVALVGHQGNECVPWPLARDDQGRGWIGHEGKRGIAARYMCRLAHGEPPTPKHVAAHSCGNGHEACVNPNHLSWKTQAQNIEDCREHGTLVRHWGGNVRRLTPAQIQTIKNARGVKLRRDLAAEYKVSQSTISDIWNGKSHTAPQKISHWTPREFALLKKAVNQEMDVSDMPAFIGRPLSSIYSKIRREGLI
jgi:hypothetical protein